MRQYFACKFRLTDQRSFTYHFDGEPFVVGDQVRVPDRSGEGWKMVHVDSISDVEPSFPTKPILGKYEPEPAPEPELAIEKEDF